LLATNKKTTPPMFTKLSLDHAGGVIFGEIRDSYPGDGTHPPTHPPDLHTHCTIALYGDSNLVSPPLVGAIGELQALGGPKVDKFPKLIFGKALLYRRDGQSL